MGHHRLPLHAELLASRSCGWQAVVATEATSCCQCQNCVDQIFSLLSEVVVAEIEFRQMSTALESKDQQRCERVPLHAAFRAQVPGFNRALLELLQWQLHAVLERQATQRRAAFCSQLLQAVNQASDRCQAELASHLREVQNAEVAVPSQGQADQQHLHRMRRLTCLDLRVLQQVLELNWRGPHGHHCQGLHLCYSTEEVGEALTLEVVLAQIQLTDVRVLTQGFAEDVVAFDVQLRADGAQAPTLEAAVRQLQRDQVGKPFK
mmetsp:Transcript_41324/g.96019  ORF Transcript_41324/g.96019 Transcript_41324/m.96019 type:complete len:263 (+) Transcript_41324:777-1565(+)